MGSWWHTYRTSDAILTPFQGAICIVIIILITGILICHVLKCCCFEEGFSLFPERVIVQPGWQPRQRPALHRPNRDVEVYPQAEVLRWENDRFRLPVEREDDFMFGIQEARVTMMTKRKEKIQRRATVQQKMQASQIGAICSICSLEFEPGDKVMVFDCHKTHMLHDECFDQLAKFAEEKRQELTCPICRQKVNKDKIVKKQLLEAEANVEDPFKMVDQENQAKLEVKVDDVKP